LACPVTTEEDRVFPHETRNVISRIGDERFVTDHQPGPGKYAFLFNSVNIIIEEDVVTNNSLLEIYELVNVKHERPPPPACAIHWGQAFGSPVVPDARVATACPAGRPRSGPRGGPAAGRRSARGAGRSPVGASPTLQERSRGQEPES